MPARTQKRGPAPPSSASALAPSASPTAAAAAPHQTIRVIHPKPDVERGVAYWQGVPASVNGVLGGYGLGTVPRIDSMGSRLFLLKNLKRLSNIPPASADPHEWIEEKMRWRTRGEEDGKEGKAVTRALDCGAGVGRVTQSVLLPLIDEVHLVEPVEKFLQEAKSQSSKWKQIQTPIEKQPFSASKAVHFHEATLQAFDPQHPYASSLSKTGKRKAPSSEVDGADGLHAHTDPAIPPTHSIRTDSPPPIPEQVSYDVIWIQWCLQHLSDPDLLSFLRRCKAALKPARDASLPSSAPTSAKNQVFEEEERAGGMIFIKENVCSESPEDGVTERSIWDDEDHSITRSTKAYQRVFREAGLELVDCQVQLGLPEELFVVKMWALR